MPHPVRALVGRPPSPPSRGCLVSGPGGGRCPLLPRMGHQVQRTELVKTDNDLRVILARFGLASGDCVKLVDPPGFGLCFVKFL